MQDQQSVLNQLKAFILDNQLCVGDHLPAERKLATMLSTSRTTVRRVLQALAERGLISRNRQGRHLVNQALLDTIVERAVAQSTENASNIISAMVIMGADSGPQLWLQNYLLERKQILNLYHSQEGDAQLPSIEAGYLRSLLSTRPRALLAHLTPLEPTNAGLLRELEDAGTQVIHIGWYSRTLPDQAFFLIDFECAGQMAVMYLAEKGCCKVCVTGMEKDTPYAYLFSRGIEAAARLLGVELIDVDLPWTGPGFEDTALCRNFKKLDASTGLILNNAESISGTYQVCQDLFDGDIPFPMIGVGNYDPDGKAPLLIPYLGVSWKERIKAAVELALGKPDSPRHQLFKPVLLTPQTILVE